MAESAQQRTPSRLMLFALPEDQIEIARIDEDTGSLAQYKNGILAMDGINQKRESTGQAEVPESDGNGAFLFAFAFNPLNEKPHGKQRLSGEANDQPYIEFNHCSFLLFRLGGL